MKPFVRPPLVITTEPTKHNFYVTFNPDTGKVTGMTPQKQGNCVAIDEYLANQIQKGVKTFFDFKVEPLSMSRCVDVWFQNQIVPVFERWCQSFRNIQQY